MSTSLQNVDELHDLLLAHKPSEASHDSSLCPLCAKATDGGSNRNNISPRGGDVSTYTDEELQARVSEATANLQRELDELKASQEQAAIEARIAEISEAKEAEVAEIQTQLDQAVAETEASKKQYEELVTLLEEEKARAEAEALLETRREEVKEAVSDIFNEEHVNANLDRWASLDAEVFEGMLEDWKAIKPANASNEKPKPPVSTAMSNGGGGMGDGSPTIEDMRRNLQRNRNAVRSVGASVN